MGVLKRVNGAVALGVVVAGCGSGGLWFLSINIFQLSAKKREVVMAIKSAIQFCWHGSLEQVDDGIITMAQLFGYFFDISDIFFYVIVGWVKREGSPSLM